MTEYLNESMLSNFEHINDIIVFRLPDNVRWYFTRHSKLYRDPLVKSSRTWSSYFTAPIGY